MMSEVKKRCIMIFPKFKNHEKINHIREKYDPLVHHVEPHITLAFPFDSTISKEKLEEHLQDVLKDIEPFELVLDQLMPSTEIGHYLFLCIAKGKDKVEVLHETIYTGILEDVKPEWLKYTKFMPHMTLGNFKDTKSLNKAYEGLKEEKYLFETIVDTISVEIIDENEDSIIEIEVKLAG